MSVPGDVGRSKRLSLVLRHRPWLLGLSLDLHGWVDVTTLLDAHAGHGVWHKLQMPAVDPFVAPIVYAAPAQLLAYHTAVLKGTDVDQPRNLAKSVTVE